MAVLKEFENNRDAKSTFFHWFSNNTKCHTVENLVSDRMLRPRKVIVLDWTFISDPVTR